jgi:uncharacterized protein YdhG (YjbR/CyaY superfamily)
MAAATIDEYLAGVRADQRGALEDLRGLIHAAAPEAVESIAYGLPAFRLDGRYFLGFGANKASCSFYAGRAPLVELAAELAGYRQAKGTINFSPDRPLPADLVTKIIRVRLGEFRGA